MAKLILIPVTTVHVIPSVSAKMADASVIVTGGSMTINGVSYKQVQNSFGTDAYSPFDMYMQSQNLAQLTTPMQFFILDADGNKMLYPLTPTVDPYQTNNSIYYQPKKNQVVFNGNSGLNFNILPLTEIIFQFICNRVSNQSLGHATNFRELEKIQNVPSFFLEYNEDLTKKAPLVLSTSVKNNTTVTQNVDLFSSPYDQMQNVNNHTEYKWDITGLTFPSTVEVTLEYKNLTAVPFSLYDNYCAGNILSILATLNALGLSYFYTYSELGVDYIATYNDNYIFGDLTLDTSGASTTTTTTTSTTTAPPTTTTTTTTTSTTTPPPTTTTTTTTTSTTTLPILNINYIATSAGVALACTTITAVGASPNTGNFCTATQLIGAALATLPVDTYYFSFGGNYLVGTTNGTSIATITGGGCLACPVATTTTTTTTTTTSTTTPPPTTTTTTTTTSTTTPPPTTTTTTTTTTTASTNINVTFYAELNAADVNAHTLWYSTDNWATSAKVSGTNITTTGQLIGTVVVPSGSTVYAAVGNTIDIGASTAVSGKVSVTPNDYAALPLVCGGSVNTTQFVDFTYNILANSLSFSLACTP